MLDEKILKVLRNKRDNYVSSEELCKLADISRAAIWKHVEKLRDEGYDIEASPHLGYKLVNIPDALIPSEVKWKLDTKILAREVISYKKVDSTNDIAYELAEKGAREGLVVFTEEQAKGKGRLGRHWISPAKSGIYMSCVLRPDIAPNEIPKITLLAAVAVAEAIRKFTGLDAMIKWPNDILINGKKICGILTEMKAEQDTADFVVVGIGINVNSKHKALPKGASSIKEESASSEDISRIGLARQVLEFFERDYLILKKKGFEPIIDKWKDLSLMLGSKVKVMLHDRTFEGYVQDIDRDGSIVIRHEPGILEKVSSGDIVMVR